MCTDKFTAKKSNLPLTTELNVVAFLISLNTSCGQLYTEQCYYSSAVWSVQHLISFLAHSG